MKLSQSLLKSRYVLKILRYNLPSHSELEPGQTDHRLELNPQVHLALDPQKGRISLDTTSSIKLSLFVADPPPLWSELAIHLHEPEWLQCQTIRVKFCAQAQSSTSVATALRMISEDGFRDYHAPQKINISREPSFFEDEFSIVPDMRTSAETCAVHIFFNNEECTLEVHDLEIIGSS